MKKFILAAALLIAVILSACSGSGAWDASKLEKGMDSSEISNNIVAASMKDTDFSKGRKIITILLENKTDQEFMYGQDPHLEVLLKNAWYTVPVKEGVAWTAIGILLQPGGTNEYTEELDFYYDNLIAGHYRYIKPLSGSTAVNVSVEFDIT